jgi:hypothetical protein
MAATYGNRSSYLSSVGLSQMTDLVRREWVYYQYEIPKAAKELFIYDYVGDGQGSSKRYNEIDVEMFSQRKYEGEDSQVASVSVGYEKDLIAATKFL